jgi:hypothetical protein
MVKNNDPVNMGKNFGCWKNGFFSVVDPPTYVGGVRSPATIKEEPPTIIPTPTGILAPLL